MALEARNQPQYPEGLTPEQEALADSLFEIGAIKFGAFRLTLHETYPDAPLSPIYVDLRMLRRFPKEKALAIGQYEQLILPLRYDLLADIPTAATPIVASLSDRLFVGQVTPRTDEKSHGGGAKVDGMMPEDVGKTAVLIDDLVTKADSKLVAAKILEAAGITVRDIVVLIDREQGGARQLADAGYRLHAAIKFSKLLDYYYRVGKIDEAKYTEARDYLAANS